MKHHPLLKSILTAPTVKHLNEGQVIVATNQLELSEGLRINLMQHIATRREQLTLLKIIDNGPILTSRSA